MQLLSVPPESTFNLPYMDARMSLHQMDASAAIQYESLRTHRNEPCSPISTAAINQRENRFHAQPDTLEHWLTARYCLYSANRKGELFRGEINHPPWTLRNAKCEIQQNTMGDPYGFDFTATPNLLYADAIKCPSLVGNTLLISRDEPPLHRTPRRSDTS